MITLHGGSLKLSMFVPKVTFLSRPVAVVFCFRILPCLSICHSNLPRDIFHLGPHLSTHPQALDVNDGQCPGCPNFLLRCALPALKREVLRVSLFGGGVCLFCFRCWFYFYLPVCWRTAPQRELRSRRRSRNHIHVVVQTNR